MINLKSLLLEVHMQDLYHATYHDRLLNMIKSQAIKLSYAGGTEADQSFNKGYPFFLSTARTKYSNWAGGSDAGVKYIGQDTVIHLDARALTAAGYKVFPVDFWGLGPNSSEQEERVVSNKDEIPLIPQFIKDIHIYINKDTKNPHVVERLHEINKYAQTSNIPIYFYPPGTEAYFKSQRIEKAVRDLSNILPPPEWTPEDLAHKDWLEKRVLNKIDDIYLRVFMDIYYGNPVDTSVHPGKTVMNWILYYPHDAYGQLMAEVHNLKTKHPPIFREIVLAIKKEGLKTFKDLIKLVIDREGVKEKMRRDAEREKWNKMI